jgi:hypothetical protein
MDSFVQIQILEMPIQRSMWEAAVAGGREENVVGVISKKIWREDLPPHDR